MVSSAMHGLWLMPLQILVALLLLYAHLGPAVFMTLAVIAGVTVITAFANKLNLGYQLKFFAVTEMLNNMRVIKLQAWEETFGDKVRRPREDEVGRVRRFMLFMCANNVAPFCTVIYLLLFYLYTAVEASPAKYSLQKTLYFTL
jgi:ATP-binding cassette, subfamily C (CFTR/MRP), member 1